MHYNRVEVRQVDPQQNATIRVPFARVCSTKIPYVSWPSKNLSERDAVADTDTTTVEPQHVTPVVRCMATNLAKKMIGMPSYRAGTCNERM